MTVTINVPEEFARRLAADDAALAKTAIEALAIEGVRSGKLTTFQARQLLGIESRFEMDAFLKEHRVFFEMTVEDVLKDAETAHSAAR